MQSTMELLQKGMKQISSKATQTYEQMESPSNEKEEIPGGSDCVIDSEKSRKVYESNDVNSSKDVSSSKDVNNSKNDQSFTASVDQAASPNTNLNSSTSEQSFGQTNTSSERKRKSGSQPGPKSKTRRCVDMNTGDKDTCDGVFF